MEFRTKDGTIVNLEAMRYRVHPENHEVLAVIDCLSTLLEEICKRPIYYDATRPVSRDRACLRAISGAMSPMWPEEHQNDVESCPTCARDMGRGQPHTSECASALEQEAK